MKTSIWLVLSVLIFAGGVFSPQPIASSAAGEAASGNRLHDRLPAQQAEICPLAFQPVSRPLTELGNDPYVRMDGQTTEFRGGLYPDGSNTPPAGHLQAGLALAAQVIPLDAEGRPDPQRGWIGMLSVGMSNANAEFGAFVQIARRAAGRNPRLVIVNGAQANQTAERWTDPQAPSWSEVERRLERQKLTAAQVQVVWLKQTHPRGGPFPQTAQALQTDLETIVHNLHAKFPNLKLVFLSSRTRSYRIERGLSPEPAAFETGFAVKWLIEKQIDGDPSLNYDPANGPVAAPFLVWGPYLWIDGERPRADGQVWLASDLRPDCTHPSPSGVDKVATMLLAFFSTDPLARDWFLQAEPDASTATRTQPVPSATSLPSATPPPTETPLPKSYRATVLAGLRPTRPGTTPAALAPTTSPGSPTPAGIVVRPLPARRLAPLGLAFIIVLSAVTIGGVWYLLRGGRRKR